MTRLTAEAGPMKPLVRTIQWFLVLGFIASVYHTCASASFWIALLQAQASDGEDFADYIRALSGPVLDLLRHVEFLAVATIVELMLRIQQLMVMRPPRLRGQDGGNGYY